MAEQSSKPLSRLPPKIWYLIADFLRLQEHLVLIQAGVISIDSLTARQRQFLDEDENSILRHLATLETWEPWMRELVLRTTYDHGSWTVKCDRPLHLAVKHGKTEMALLLLEKGGYANG
jgi:hypothetical protein